MDDTLVVEEASAETAFRAVCRFANRKIATDIEGLYRNIRESCRSIWYTSPAHPFCLKVGISSWEGLWAEFKGDNKALYFFGRLGTNLPTGVVARSHAPL